MSKWKCEICGNEFENFHAQGFDNKIYCPLCFFKRENQKYKEVINKAKSLNEEISHIIYEDFLEENVIGCKYLYEIIKKQLDILKEVE